MKRLFEWLDNTKEFGKAYMIMEWDTFDKSLEMFTEVHPEVEFYQVYELPAPIISWADFLCK